MLPRDSWPQRCSKNFARSCQGSQDASKMVSLGSLGYKDHKSREILPKFSPTLHFLQEFHTFMQESQILQSCYNVEHFLQDSDNISAKIPFCVRSLYKKCYV